MKLSECQMRSSTRMRVTVIGTEKRIGRRMSSSFLIRLNIFLHRVKNGFPIVSGRGFPPEPLCVAACPSYSPMGEPSPSSKPFSIKDLIGDGIFWAVPRTRRTIEKRLKRRFGSPQGVLKILVPKQTLRVCNQCGHDHEVGVLCPHCYQKVQDETKLIQEKIASDLGLNPDDKDVVVLYDGEKGSEPSEFWNGKRIVEMHRPRPLWFSKNLLQKTTQQGATTKEVKPSDLG